MTSDQRLGKIYEHLEKAQQADDQAAKNYHIREALQLLRIADEAAYRATDTTEESVD